MIIREEQPEDRAAIFSVIERAFGQPGEATLVDALRDGGHVALSLVAIEADHIVGHVLMSNLRIIGDGGEAAALALAPVAVPPDHQNRGIGSALIRKALELCKTRGHRSVIVLGEPGYYGRFGFSAAIVRHLESPYAGEYFMGLELVPRSLEQASGRVEYAPPFRAV